jgi:hypothetical protein
MPTFLSATGNTPSPNIFYVLALPDWEPNEVTPFQGFAPGLIYFVPLMEFIPALPADIFDPTMELDDRLARRRSGDGCWLWTPVNLSTLLAKRKPSPSYPYMVVFSADQETARKVSEWRKGLRIKPIHVSFYKGGGAIHPADFTPIVLGHHLAAIARKAASVRKTLDIEEHLEVLSEWQPQQRRPCSLKFHSHNVTKPNEMTLIGAGEEPAHGEEGHLQSSPLEDYVHGISETAEAVMALWERTRDRPAYFVSPPRPDIFLVAPASYRGMSKKVERALKDPLLKSAMRALDRQRGYTIELELEGGGPDEAHINLVGPIFGLRGAEMKLTTTAVGLRTAGTVAAAIRLPPAVNRTGGVVGQLARFLRTHENPPPIKSARVFKAVQDALREYVPEEHLNLIARSEAGIKIIADAPIEWLPVAGLPLGIRFDVSRINSTPGNLFLEQIRPPMPMFIPPEAFRNYLVLSMFDDGDPIAPHLRVGTLGTKDEDGQPIIGSFASPKTIDQFAEAISKFKGPLLIVDSHAQHPDGDEPGGLIIGGASFDVWSLAGKVQMPPIVILSACDTHPFDRNHATVANGFLSCGAAAVVATALPIRGTHAARFVMRLINRAVHYGEIMNGMGRAVSWSHIVGGLLRMELSVDILRHFQSTGRYDEDTRKGLQLKTNMDLNPHNPSWYELMIERIRAACNVMPENFEREVADVIAASDAIRYLHLGNPEAIMIADHRAASRALGRDTNALVS